MLGIKSSLTAKTPNNGEEKAGLSESRYGWIRKHPVTA